MDKRIVYAGQIPYESDILFSNRFATVGVGQLAGAVFGTGTWLKGFGYTVTTNSTPFVVQIAPGQIYVDSVVDDSAYSSLAADATVIKQQGLLTAAQSFQMARPSNNAKYYVIEARFDFVDEDNAALIYYNAADPSIPFVGPGNAGTSQPTIRRGKCVLSLLAGGEAAAPTVPTVSAGAVALYTIYLTSTTSSIPASAVSTATTEGIFDAAYQNGHFINLGGTGNLTSSTADTLYGRKNQANTWAGVQTVTVANATPVILTGGTADGTGISITGNGSTNPKKTIRVKDGNFQVLSHDDTAIPLNLTNGGALTVLGKVVAASPADENDTTALATVSFTEGRYAVSGSYVTQDAADLRYVLLTGQGSTAAATLPRAPLVEITQMTGSQPNGLSDNELITRAWAVGTFATSAAAGMSQDQADGRYLQTGLGTNTTGSVSGVITFANQVKLSTTPTGSVGAAAVNVDYLSSNYKKTDEAGTFTQLTLTNGSNTPDDDEAVRKDYIATNYASKGATTYTAGSHDFSAGTVLVQAPSEGTHAANRSYVDTEISGVNSTISGFTSASDSETITGTWSFEGAATLANTAVISGVQGTNDNSIVRYDSLTNLADLDSQFIQAFSSPVRVSADSSDDDDVVRHSQIFGAASTLAQLSAANTFTSPNTFTRQSSGANGRNGSIFIAPPVGHRQITFGSNDAGTDRKPTIFYDNNNDAALRRLAFKNGNGTELLSIFDNNGIVSGQFGQSYAWTHIGTFSVVGAAIRTGGLPEPTNTQPTLGDNYMLVRGDLAPSRQKVRSAYSGVTQSHRYGYSRLPNGIVMAWGTVNMLSNSTGPGLNAGATEWGYASKWVDVNSICGIPPADEMAYVHNVQVTADHIPDGAGTDELFQVFASNRNTGPTQSFAIYSNSTGGISGTPHYFYCVGAVAN